MKQIRGWSTSVTVTSLLALAVAAFPSAATASNHQGTFQVAQAQAQAAADNCRRAEAVGGLVIRQQPSIGATAVGVVPNGQTVTIENRGANGWVPVTAPLRGFVSANFLRACVAGTTPPVVPPAQALCRRVNVRTSLNVRREPSANAAVVGSVAGGQNVTIRNVGAQGWVPITNPIQGFVSASFLGPC